MADDGESDSPPGKGYFEESGGLVVAHSRKQGLENGGDGFQSANANGQGIKSYGKSDKVKLGDRKPIKFK